MTEKKVEDQERRQSGLAPETHNDEQDDHRQQAQEVSEQAQTLDENAHMPTESERGPGDNDLMNDSTQDTVERMKDMESSGRVDMGAFRGEATHDDNVDKYGKDKKPDGLRGDGT